MAIIIKDPDEFKIHMETKDILVICYFMMLGDIHDRGHNMNSDEKAFENDTECNI